MFTKIIKQENKFLDEKISYLNYLCLLRKSIFVKKLMKIDFIKKKLLRELKRQDLEMGNF
jgi:hypothetical protein